MMEKLSDLFTHYRKRFVLPLLQNLIAALLLVACCIGSVVFLHLFLRGDGPVSVGGLAASAAFLLCLFAVYAVVNRRACRQSLRSGHQISADLRLKLCNHLRKLPLSYFDRNTTSKVSNTLVSDMVYTESVFSVYLHEIAIGLLIPSALLLVMLFIDWRVALGVFALLPALFLLRRSSHCAAISAADYIDARDHVDHCIEQYLEGIRELKNANRTGVAFAPFVPAHDAFQQLSLQIEKRLGLYCQSYIGVLELSFVVIFVIGSLSFAQGSLPLILLILLMLSAQRIIEPLQLLGVCLTEFRFALGAAGRVAEIFDKKPLPLQSGGAAPSDHGFSFTAVSFSYGDKAVFKDFNLQVTAGSVTALVGPSGSGKTTIANLLLRFRDVDHGCIRVGGSDIRGLTQEQLSSLFSVVFQEVYLFNDTAMNNIRMGRTEATNEQVREAARLACCHDFIIALEHGYDTQVGQNGAKLSGGERQRIAIARAILSNAPILILDEATASIDPENELLIQRGLSNLIRGRTLLVIAHRLSTIRHADQIVVLDQGKIVEQGRHDELMALTGHYHAQWIAQSTIKSWSFRSNPSAQSG